MANSCVMSINNNFVTDPAPEKRISWLMGKNQFKRAIYLKYLRSASFAPYSISSGTLHAFFNETIANAAWVS